MNIQRFCHRFCLTTGLIVAMAGTQSTVAETFSFNLKGFDTSDSPDGPQTLTGSMTFDSDQMSESKTLDFDLTHRDDGAQQSLDLGIRNQSESILEAVFDIFGLTSRSQDGKLDANVSGDITPTDSKIDIDFGENMPGMRVKVKTPQ